jgi:hypothetical protein
MKGDTTPEGDGDAAQAPGPEKRKPAPDRNLPSIRDLIQSLRQEWEHEIIVQCILVLRLKEICLQSSGAYQGRS